MVVRSAGLQLVRAASSIIDRMRAVGLAGVTFGGNRDIFEACGYERRLLLKQYRARYNRGDMASRIVEAYPESTWRGTGQDAVYDDESPDVETPFERAWNDLNKRLRIWSVLYRADVLAGLGHYAVILIGAPGDMGSPLPPVLKADDVKYLVPYAQEDAPITRWVEKTDDARFGQPEQYQLRRTSQLSYSSEFMRAPMAGLLSRPVHWSRVIHICEGMLDDEVFGKPRLERVWNRLDDLDKVVGAGSESFWQRAHQGVQFNVDKEIEFDPEEADELNRNIREFIHTQTRAIKTRGVDMNVMGSDVADFSKNVASLVSLISATTKIPQRLLLGSERGELASTTDRDTWVERVQDRRTRLAEPFMLRALVDRFIQHGIMPRPKAKPKAEQTPDANDDAPATKSPFQPKAQGAPKPTQRTEERAAAPAIGVGIEPDLPVHVRADVIPFAKPQAVEGELVDEDESAQSADYEVYWDAVLDLPQAERLDNAVKAKELGPRVITDAEIRESIGLEPMSEEDLAAADEREEVEKQREIEKIQAKGPSPFGAGKPGFPPGAADGDGPKEPPMRDAALRSLIVKRCGKKWCLFSHKGKVLGTHDTAKEAYAQEAAIKYAQRQAEEAYAHDGLFVYLKVDPGTAQAIAVRGLGAEDPGSMHVTIAYCDGDFDAALSAVRSVAESAAPLVGATAGIGTFPPSEQSEGRTVLWVRPDVPGLQELHERIVGALSVDGIYQRTERPYVPHITLAYVSPDDQYELPMIAPQPLHFTQLCMSKGERKVEFTLGESVIDVDPTLS